jgi:hypothetical protein
LSRCRLRQSFTQAIVPENFNQVSTIFDNGQLIITFVFTRLFAADTRALDTGKILAKLSYPINLAIPAIFLFLKILFPVLPGNNYKTTNLKIWD